MHWKILSIMDEVRYLLGLPRCIDSRDFSHLTGVDIDEFSQIPAQNYQELPQVAPIRWLMPQSVPAQP